MKTILLLLLFSFGASVMGEVTSVKIPAKVKSFDQNKVVCETPKGTFTVQRTQVFPKKFKSSDAVIVQLSARELASVIEASRKK